MKLLDLYVHDCVLCAPARWLAYWTTVQLHKWTVLGKFYLTFSLLERKLVGATAPSCGILDKICLRAVVHDVRVKIAIATKPSKQTFSLPQIFGSNWTEISVNLYRQCGTRDF